MMSPPPKFLEVMLGFKQKIDDGLVPKSNFPNIQGLLKEEDFDVDIQRKKSNAAAGLTDFIIKCAAAPSPKAERMPLRTEARTLTHLLVRWWWQHQCLQRHQRERRADAPQGPRGDAGARGGHRR